DLPAEFLLVLAEPLLQPAEPLVFLALHKLQVVVRELGVFLFQLAFDLVPVAFDLECIHANVSRPAAGWMYALGTAVSASSLAMHHRLRPATRTASVAVAG